MTAPKPIDVLTDALRDGNPRKTAAAIEALINRQIWAATGREVPTPYVNNSTTTRTYL